MIPPTSLPFSNFAVMKNVILGNKLVHINTPIQKKNTEKKSLFTIKFSPK